MDINKGWCVFRLIAITLIAVRPIRWWNLNINNHDLTSHPTFKVTELIINTNIYSKDDYIEME